MELALLSPLLLLMLAGVLDYGLALRTATAVSNAARAAAQYGTESPSNLNNTAGIRAAALNSAPTLTGMTVTSATSCQCPAGSVVSCTGSCSTGKMLIYLNVTVTATPSNWFHYAGLPFPATVGAQASMRAQ